MQAACGDETSYSPATAFLSFSNLELHRSHWPPPGQDQVETQPPLPCLLHLLAAWQPLVCALGWQQETRLSDRITSVLSLQLQPGKVTLEVLRSTGVQEPDKQPGPIYGVFPAGGWWEPGCS